MAKVGSNLCQIWKKHCKITKYFKILAKVAKILQIWSHWLQQNSFKIMMVKSWAKLCRTLHQDVSVVLPLDVLIQVPPVGQPGRAGVLLARVDHPLRLSDVFPYSNDPTVSGNGHDLFIKNKVKQKAENAVVKTI